MGGKMEGSKGGRAKGRREEGREGGISTYTYYLNFNFQNLHFGKFLSTI